MPKTGIEELLQELEKTIGPTTPQFERKALELFAAICSRLNELDRPPAETHWGGSEKLPPPTAPIPNEVEPVVARDKPLFDRGKKKGGRSRP